MPLASLPTLDVVNSSSFKNIESILCISCDANCTIKCKSLSLLVVSTNMIPPDFFVSPYTTSLGMIGCLNIIVLF